MLGVQEVPGSNPGIPTNPSRFAVSDRAPVGAHQRIQIP